MDKPLLLWINSGACSLREASRSEFASCADVCEIDASALPDMEAESGWDVMCFNFDYPDMSGLKLVPWSKKHWPSVPIVLLTLQNSMDLALWALRTRVFDVLVKPVTPEEIERCMRRVRRALQARESQSQRGLDTTMIQMPAEMRYHAMQELPAKLNGVAAHVAKYYGRHIPAAEMAQLCGLSPSAFSRDFKVVFGLTFVDYLTNYRLTQAKRLLENPLMPVTDVAAAVGFDDPSYFTRVFRREEGLSPSEYRLAAQRSA